MIFLVFKKNIGYHLITLLNNFINMGIESKPRSIDTSKLTLDREYSQKEQAAMQDITFQAGFDAKKLQSFINKDIRNANEKELLIPDNITLLKQIRKFLNTNQGHYYNFKNPKNKVSEFKQIRNFVTTNRETTKKITSNLKGFFCGLILKFRH